MNLIDGFQQLATAPDGVARLRELILSLAVQGRLVPQDSRDEPATTLLQRVRHEKDSLIAEGKIKRDTPVALIADAEKPYDLPVGWEWCSLDQIAAVGTGTTPPRDNRDYYFPPSTRWVTSGETGQPFIENTAQHVSDLALRETSLRVYPAHTLIIAMYGQGKTRGQISELLVPAATNQACAGIVLINEETYHRRYVKLFFEKIYDEIREQAAGGAQPNLNVGKVKSTLIPIPPLAEQARIVAKVDELMRLCDELENRGRLEAEQHARLTATLFDALAASESSHALAENWARVAAHFDLLLDRPEAVDALERTILELAVRGLLLPVGERNGTTSLLDETTTANSFEQADGATDDSLNVAPYDIPLSWSWIRFGEIMRDLRYGTSAKCDYEIEGIPVLRIPNLKNGRISTEDLKFGVLTTQEVARLALVPGDLLLVRSNGSATLVGSAALVGEESRDFAFAGYLMRIRLREDVALPTYILLALETEGVRAQIEGPIRTTSGVKNINSTEVSRLRLPLPPLDTQYRIVDQVDNLRCLCADLRERLSTRQTCQTHFAEALVGQAVFTAPLAAGTDDLAAAA
ncbi:restriction endonuclease subunit S [Paraburkholderia nemoris]|uniref:restriction endonuclease subunit S n=1 Tax=Paraburkholderia nemoris TaxID=2793076 RepID=UPI0038B7DEB5